MLDQGQKQQFWRDGNLLARDAVSAQALGTLRVRLDDWVAESRNHKDNWGRTLDDLPRFDLEAGHSCEQPRLRRINNPSEIDTDFHKASFDSAMADMVADLIGPDVTFHHSKINIKLPQTESRVGLHQDFSYTPHTNDDLVTALLLLDDMTMENGPLLVADGSHRGPQQSLWQEDRFTGQINPAQQADWLPRLRPVTGKAGDVCLMHTNLVHGSKPNASPQRRALYITVYTAADAFPLRRSPLPNRLEKEVVRGQATRTARLQARKVELPEDFRAASFFHLTGQGTNS